MQDQSHQYNWVSVISFIQKEYSKNSLREKQWLFEKHNFQEKINRLEAQIISNQIIQTDLLKRIKLLQVALFELRYKSNNIKTIQQTNIINNLSPASQVQLQTNNHFLQTLLTNLGIKQPIDDHIPQKEHIYFEHHKGSLKLVDSITTNIKQQNKIAAHLDAVRQIHCNQQKSYLATVSEDCLFKIWNYDSLLTPDPQPVATFRQHTGPLFSLTGGKNTNNPDQDLLFTGGSEGYIKCWKVEDIKDVSKTTLRGGWNNFTDQKNQDNTIWQLKLRGNKLLTSGSDGFVRMFEINQQFVNKRLEIVGKLFKAYKDKQFNQTSIQWVSERTFIAGCQNAPRAILWDIDKKINQKFIYQTEKAKQPHLSQVNCTHYFHKNKILAVGCQDKYLRLFDFNNGKIVKKLANKSSISTLGTKNPWEILCGCHDGSLSIWDLRKYSMIWNDNDAHLTKYDQGLHTIISDDNIILTGGADGIIKIYK